MWLVSPILCHRKLGPAWIVCRIRRGEGGTSSGMASFLVFPSDGFDAQPGDGEPIQTFALITSNLSLAFLPPMYLKKLTATLGALLWSLYPS